MLSSFTLENFKSYREATLDLEPLTVLVGANASGKSNLVEALRLSSWIAQGNRLGSIRHALRGNECPIRGDVKDLFRGGKRSFQLSCRTTRPDWNLYSIELERRGDGELHISEEKLSRSDERVPLFQIMDRNRETGAVWAAYNNFAPGGRKPQVPCNDQEAVLMQLQSPARFSPRHKKSYELISQISKEYLGWLSRIMFLDPRPSVMRAYGNMGNPVLRGDGENLSGALYNICKQSKGKSRLLEFVEDLPEQDIHDIDFIETPRGEAMVNLVESFDGKHSEYDAVLLSDGTLRVLAIAAAALSAPEGGMIVIEEIDNGVHASRVERLLTRLSSIAEERGLRILLTSHNPALLDALPDEAAPNVVFCYRDTNKGSSRLVRLGDIDDYPALIMRGRLGESMTTGAIDHLAKRQLSPEEREQRATAWLADLRQQVG